MTRGRQIHCGYTLVEVLVVIAILGVLVTTAAYGIRGDSARTTRAEAERLANLLELAQARARLGGGAIAFSASSSGYAFWRRDEAGVWREFGNDSDLQPRALPNGINVTGFQAGGIAVGMGQRFPFSMDDPAAFSIALAGASTRATVESGAFVGRVNVGIAAPRFHE